MTVKSNYTTISFPITMSEKSLNSIRELRRIQSSVIRSSYNYYNSGYNLDFIQERLRTNFKSKLGSYFISSGRAEGCTIYESSLARNVTKIIFGSKKLFRDLSLGKITKDVFKEARLQPVVVIGEAPKSGNRHFYIDLKTNCIIFKENKGNHHKLYLPKLSKKNFELLTKLDLAMCSKELPVTFKVTDNEVKIGFDYSKLKSTFDNKISNPISNRVIGIDLNPNFIGMSIIDINYNKVIYSKQYDLKQLNITSGLSSDHPKSININNKRLHETYEIAKDIASLAKHYRISKVIVEDLSIVNCDKGNGKYYNRLTNNCWPRNKFINNLRKRTLLLGIDFREVNPQYTSFIGNVNYGVNDIIPDPIAASIEIARRGHYQFTKDKSIHPTTVNIEFLQNLWKKDVETVVSEKKQSCLQAILNSSKVILDKNDWGILYEVFGLKSSRMRYRASHDKVSFLDFYSIKSKVRYYQVIPGVTIYM